MSESAAREALQSIYSEVLSGAEAEYYSTDESHALIAKPFAVVFPETHQQVLDTVNWSRRFSIPIVPSGGRTGLSGAACAGNNELVLSFEKMNRLINIDEQAGLLTVEPGMSIEMLQHHAKESGWFYPVDYASKGTAQIGGGVSTNAGGIRVLRYGMTREWIAGLKVVTGEGETLCIDRCLKKDNAGIDLQNLFIGSEGTLGLITEITVRLTHPMPVMKTILIGVDSLEQLVTAFTKLNKNYTLYAAEFFCDESMDIVTRAHQLSNPLGNPSAYYLLIELDQSDYDEESLIDVLQLDKIIVCHNEKQQKQIWALRELISSTINPLHPYKNDIACQLNSLEHWFVELEAGFKAINQDVRFVWFGHMGDGNAHLNVIKPDAMQQKTFDQLIEQFDDVVFSVTQRYQATASAEHGVGVLKKKLLSSCRSPEEIRYFKALKSIFDPDSILNPGKVFD